MALGIATAGLVAGALAGCGPSEERWESDGVIQAVVWPQGAPDDGEWADDPWVQAWRRWGLVRFSASAANDYSAARWEGFESTDQQLASLAQSRLRAVERSWDEEDPVGVSYPPGPAPMYVLAVEELSAVAGGPRSAVVYVCAPLVWSVSDPADVPTAVDDLDLAVMTGRLQETTGGNIVVVDTGRSSGVRHPVTGVPLLDEDCDASKIRMGFFDPAPPIGQTVYPWQVLDSQGEPVAEYDAALDGLVAPAYRDQSDGS
ncbi:MAG TPA: hypothetical protein VGC67_02895 [Cellulomonas sp.]